MVWLSCRRVRSVLSQSVKPQTRLHHTSSFWCWGGDEPEALLVTSLRLTRRKWTLHLKCQHCHSRHFEGGRYHVLELPVSLALLISELCRGLTWILCPNAMLLSADTSWIRWVCPSMLIKRAPSTALHLSATWGTHFWRERKIFVLWLTKILITTNVRLKKNKTKKSY